MRINMLRLCVRVALVAAATLFASSTRAADLEAFEFGDSNGTELMNALNSINASNFWFSTNGGMDMLPSSVESGSYRVIKDFEGLSSNYLQIDNITSGRAYIVAEMTNWKFTGFDSATLEQIRFAFLNEDTGTDGNTITAQVQIGRNDAGGIELTGTAIGTAGSANISNVVELPTEQTSPFKVVLALDQDSKSFEVFYKDGTNPTQVLGLGAVSRVRDGNSIRFAVNNNFGSTNFFPTVIDEQFNIDRFALTDTNPFTDLISLEVNRDTGAMTLMNTSGAAFSGVESISIVSDTGALDPTQWKPVAGNYDSAGSGAFDVNDAWAVDNSSNTELSESMQPGGAEDGGGMTIGQNLELDVAPVGAPGTWIQSPFEDVRMVLNLIGGGMRTVDVNFVGNSGAKWQVADLDFDTDIDTDDWLTFISHAEEDLSSYSIAEAYHFGDFDSDGVNSVLDFGIFKDAYNEANGAGSFERMLAGVPEPGGIALALVATIGLAAVGRGNCRRKVSRTSMRLKYQHCPDQHQNVRGTMMNTRSLPDRWLSLLAAFVVVAVTPSARAGILEEFLFNDAAGTLIEETENNINPGHLFDTDADTGSVTTNGMGQLNASLKANTSFGSNYVDLHPGVYTPLLTGRYFGVMELTWDFQSTLDPAENEEIRFTLINNDPRGTEVTVEWEIERTDNDELVIFGNAIGTGSSDTGMTVLNGGSLTQTDKFIAVVDADLDNDVYEILYSNDAGNSFQSAGTGDLSPGRGIEALRMVLNNDLSNDNVLIDRFYFTDENPVLPVDKLKLQVNTTTGAVSILNDTTSTFDVDWYRITSSDDSLEFDNWNSLSNQEYDAIDGPDAGGDPGDGVGETWDEAGGSNDGVLSESFLLGSSVFDPDESVGLGNIFKLGGTLGGLEFQYRDAISANVFTGEIVEIMGGLIGDYNENGIVDAADYTVWRDNVGAPAGTLPNDADGGVIGPAQYATWKANFGMTAGSGSLSIATVPEPTSGLLVLMASIAVYILGRATASRVS